MESLSAFVLAGGRSSRMGSDKALLPLDGQTLLERSLHLANSVSPTTAILGSREQYAGYGEVVEDIYPGCGPLAGIHAALCATQSALNLVLSVDMPLMSAEFLLWLANYARQVRELAVVPDALGGIQPLCAFYRQPLRAVAEQALKSGDYKVSHTLSLAPTRYVSEDEIRSAGFSPDIFRNMNTPADYEALRHEPQPVARLEKASSRP